MHAHNVPLVDCQLSKEQMHQEARHMEPFQFLALRPQCFVVKQNLYEKIYMYTHYEQMCTEVLHSRDHRIATYYDYTCLRCVSILN